MKHRFRDVGYFVLWDARRQSACIARHGLNLCQIRGPECVEGCKLGGCALQLRNTRVMLRNVHYPSEGTSERANLDKELDGVDIARCFIDFGDFNSQPCGRTGDHVLMPDVRTWRKNAGSPLFVSSIDGAIAKWKDVMKDCGLAAHWVKSISIVGVDLQHNVNWADVNRFEQCLASGPLVPRALELKPVSGVCQHRQSCEVGAHTCEASHFLLLQKGSANISLGCQIGIKARWLTSVS